MQFLLVGDFRGNLGPTNVNKEIIRYKSSRFLHVDFSGRCRKYGDCLLKLIRSDVIVVSAPTPLGYYAVNLAKYLGKKTAYIMHGCAEYEAEINGITLPDADIRRERKLLECVDLLLPVSQKYSQWVKKQYPQHADKTSYWRLGIACFEQPMKNICCDNRIAAAGGDKPLKRNRVLSDAVELLQGNACLDVYGSFNEYSVDKNNHHTRWRGALEHDRFLEELCRSKIFIVNSEIESFNISVVEALQCGCSILVSDHVGAAEIMNLTKEDLICDIHDPQEIARKIAFLLDHPNHDRICSNMDWNMLSYKNAVGQLEKICEDLASKPR